MSVALGARDSRDDRGHRRCRHEAALRGSVERARQALVTELNAHTPTPTLAAAWSEVMRHSVAAAARLVAHDRQLDWTWFVALRRHRSAVS
jgi:hypothetical protein